MENYEKIMDLSDNLIKESEKIVFEKNVLMNLRSSLLNKRLELAKYLDIFLAELRYYNKLNILKKDYRYSKDLVALEGIRYQLYEHIDYIENIDLKTLAELMEKYMDVKLFVMDYEGE